MTDFECGGLISGHLVAKMFYDNYNIHATIKRYSCVIYNKK